MHELLLSAAESHGLVGASVLSDEELAALPQRHGVPVEGVRGDIVIAGKTVSLSLALRFSAPCCLPLVFMQPWDAFGVIPHVDTDGYVCYAQNEGLMLDPNRFEQVVSTSLTDAIAQITAGATGENSRDFIDEFLPYRNRQNGILSAPCFVEPGDSPKIVQAFVEGNTYQHVCDREADVRLSVRFGHEARHRAQRPLRPVAGGDGYHPSPSAEWLVASRSHHRIVSMPGRPMCEGGREALPQADQA